MKYVHQYHDHVYYVSEGMYGYTVRSTSNDATRTQLNMNSKQYENFQRMLKEGGWKDATSR